MNISKYISIFKISFQQEFAYRLNFVMWRVRNVLQIFLVFFLWDTVFSDPSRVVFGYDRAKILTYVFSLVVVKALVFSARSIDIPGEVARGDITNYLLKPLSYFKYWFTRDMASKALNLSFAVVEITLLYWIIKPPFFFQSNLGVFMLFALSIIISILLYFILLFLVNMLPFWYPEQAWGATFLLLIFADFLGGATFPLDILPEFIQKILYLTPFPYLFFVPIQIYLGNIDIVRSVQSILIAVFWTVALGFALKYVWSAGLRVYRSEGR